MKTTATVRGDAVRVHEVGTVIYTVSAPTATDARWKSARIDRANADLTEATGATVADVIGIFPENVAAEFTADAEQACIACGHATHSTVHATVETVAGGMCDDCAHWCDGNVTAAAG